VQGLKRPGLQKEYRVTTQFAIHEFGKALVATVLRKAREAQGLRPRLERIERVSMVPRGRYFCPARSHVPLHLIWSMSCIVITKSSVPAAEPALDWLHARSRHSK
jgi:hypothetical protein